jgi:hypothetical protein
MEFCNLYRRPYFVCFRNAFSPAQVIQHQMEMVWKEVVQAYVRSWYLPGQTKENLKIASLHAKNSTWYLLNTKQSLNRSTMTSV